MAKTFKKIILDDLKKRGLSRIAVKVQSIKYESYSGGDSVRVKTVDLFKQDRELFRDILENYSEGHFNGMEDIYEYKKDAPEVERTAKYVFLDNEFSDQVKENVKTELRLKYDVFDDESAQRVLFCWYDQAVYRELCKKGEF